MLDDHSLLRYSRHILLDQFDIEGQLALKKAHVVVVGCGGLGMAALPLLAGAGIGELTILDYDEVDLSNLHRQTYYKTADVGRSKVVQAKQKLTALNPDVIIHTYDEKTCFKRLEELCQSADAILDCTDNFEVRKAINRAAVSTKTPLISGSAVRYEGQLTVYDFRDETSPCYACLFDGDEASDGNCALFGVFSPVVHIIGVTQAQETLKLLLGIGKLTTRRLRIYNALDNEWREFKYGKNPHCDVCGDHVTETHVECRAKKRL